jgi:hypothetical protein
VFLFTPLDGNNDDNAHGLKTLERKLEIEYLNRMLKSSKQTQLKRCVEKGPPMKMLALRKTHSKFHNVISRQVHNGMTSNKVECVLQMLSYQLTVVARWKNVF